MLRKMGLLALFFVMFAGCWIVAAVLIGWSRSSFPNLFLAIGSVWIVVASLILLVRRAGPGAWLVIGLVVLAAMLLAPTPFFEHEPGGLPAIARNPVLESFLPQLLPALAPLMAALLVLSGFRSLTDQPVAEHVASATGRPEDNSRSRPTGRAPALAAFGLGILVLGGGFYQLYWLLVWDSTYDALDFIWLGIPILAALLGAALLALMPAGRQRRTGLLYALLVPALMIGVYRQAKAVDFRGLTAARAERIARALETYRARQGAYPEALNELVPWTMLSIPAPVILHGQDWCYQGGSDSYRLGAVNREHWSSPELYTTVYQAVGGTANDGDLCQAAIAGLRASYPGYYEVGN
jgi:hypothetical protein